MAKICAAELMCSCRAALGANSLRREPYLY